MLSKKMSAADEWYPELGALLLAAFLLGGIYHFLAHQAIETWRSYRSRDNE